MSETLYSGKKSPETLDYLLKRRSLSVKYMAEPAPSREDIDMILKAASRVPDHGKLFPWYFIVFEGEARREIGAHLKTSYRDEDPEATEAKLELEAERFLRAPLVIGVISRIRRGKHPQWEQILSAGAVCQNLSIATNALGYSANWLTEWHSYNDTFRNLLGLDKRDHVAGFVYIGTPTQAPEERPRPDVNAITTYWKKGATLNKGDAEYDMDKFEFPVAGFEVVKE